MSFISATAPAKSTEKAPERHDDGQGLEAQDVTQHPNLSYPYHISTDCTCQGDRVRVQADEGHGKGATLLAGYPASG